MQDPDKRKMSLGQKIAVAAAVIVGIIGFVIVAGAIWFALAMNSWANSK